MSTTIIYEMKAIRIPGRNSTLPLICSFSPCSAVPITATRAGVQMRSEHAAGAPRCWDRQKMSLLMPSIGLDISRVGTPSGRTWEKLGS